MRDSFALRQRLLLLACLPTLAATLGCSSADSAVPAKGDASKRDAKKPGKADAKDAKADRLARAEQVRKVRDAANADDGGDEGNPSSTPTPPGEQAAAAAPPAGDPRYLPVAGDPPYVDGYNPEEETCPSGNWCGTIATATAIAPKGDAAAKVMECPPRIVGAHDPNPITGEAYAGLSDKRQMQGTFNEGRTKRWRADGKDDACCYHWFEYCSGRPLLDGHESVVAESRVLAAWVDADVAPVLEGLSDEARARLTRAWLDDALREHASVASFARAALELLAVGAPPELVDGCMRAGQDEVDHARRCFALASAYAGRPLGPGPLQPLGPRQRELPLLAVETFLEGCVGETIAALVAERALTDTTDEAVRATLRIIAEDESRHAALAWRTIAWALQQGGLPVGLALLRLLDTPPQIAADAPALRSAALTAMLSAHGRLDEAALAQAVDDAWRDIIAPMLRGLLGRDDAATVAPAV